MIAYIKYSIVLLCLGIISSCVTEIIPEPAPTKIAVTVRNDQGNRVNGVSVYLFDNEEDFEDAKRSGDISNRIKEGITESDSNALAFDNLNYNADYYIFVSYRDRSRFIDLDNFTGSYIVPKEVLYQETTTNIQVDLLPARSTISFYTGSSPAAQFPITIFFGNDSIGVINDNTSGTPSPTNDQTALTYKISSGDAWYARSSKGCFWAGEITVDGTESYEPIELSECNAGTVTFWVSENNADLLPIDVTIDGIDHAGTLSSTGEATDCFAGSGLSIGRASGTYNYTARSTSSNCNWSGTIDIIEGGCQTIELETCNP